MDIDDEQRCPMTKHWRRAMRKTHPHVVIDEQDKRIAELEAKLDFEVNHTLGIITEQDATIRELEMMVYLYVDGADIALEHNNIMRRVIENVQKRER